MFRCQSCGQCSTPGVASVRVVLETRPKRYPFRPDVRWVFRWNKKDRKFKWEHDSDLGGVGTEIVREALVCPACAVRIRLPP